MLYYYYNVVPETYLQPPQSPKPPGKLIRLADRLGASAAFLCALHCAALPFMLALLPALGLTFLADHGFEHAFIAFATVLASVTLIIGYRRHHVFRAFWFLLPGLILLWTGSVLDGHAGSSIHALLVATGGTLVTIAHLINLRLSHVQMHVHDSFCAH